MSGFNSQTIKTIGIASIKQAVKDSFSFREVAHRLNLSVSRYCTNKLSSWCLQNDVDISHFKATSRRTSKLSIVKAIGSEELRSLAESSVNISEMCRKLGVPSTSYYHSNISFRLKDMGYDLSNLRKQLQDRKKSTSRIPDEDFFVYGKMREGQAIRKRLVSKGMEDRCSLCGIYTTWNGKYLVLQVDHIDGDTRNNLVENLRIVCPNCHTQTPTFAGRSANRGVPREGRGSLNLKRLSKEDKVKKVRVRKVFTCKSCSTPITSQSSTGLCSACVRVLSRKVTRPTKENLIAMLSGEVSFLALGKKLGVTDQAVRKWCKQFGLDTKKMGRGAMLAKKKQQNIIEPNI